MNTTQQDVYYYGMESVKRANAALGHYFFSPDTMRFFRSRLPHTVYYGRYFVTSEQFDYDSPRLYTIRVANPDGSIDTVGEFQQYRSRSAAVNAIHRMMKDA
jgi:hypothetical protein